MKLALLLAFATSIAMAKAQTLSWEAPAVRASRGEFLTLEIVPGAGHDTMALFKGLGEANWEFYREAFGQTDS